MIEIVNSILYKLKSGCQWRMLPVGHLFTGEPPRWNTVFHLSSEEHLFDEEMYKERWIVEHTNAWMDGFKAVMARFDTTISSWKGGNYLAFIVISLKKFHKSK